MYPLMFWLEMERMISREMEAQIEEWELGGENDLSLKMVDSDGG